MSTWLTAWRNRERGAQAPPIMELLVVTGADAGNQFTLEGDEVLVGRGQPESGQTDCVRLRDKSISRRQAWIRRDAEGSSLEHVATASNPTLLNGVAIDRARLAPGDRIEMGRVTLDVRARAGMNLSGLTEIMEVAARESTQSVSGLPATEPPEAPAMSEASEATELPGEATTATGLAQGEGLAEEVTDLRPMNVQIGELVLLGGDALGGEARFPLPMRPVTLGRGEAADVRIPELGVSRVHAEIRLEGRGLVLSQRSKTNPTLVNDFPVVDEVVIEDGDEIQLADRVRLGLRLGPPGARGAGAGRGDSDLSRRMLRKIDLDRQIEEYNVMGTFLDVDVVASRSMKGEGEKAEHIIVSFERFRAYVGGICEEWDGQVLNSNGDELMCFFESAASAVLAGSAILERLADFNRDLNLLEHAFRFRLGVHTGVSLVDLDAGVAYSDVLDTAGHIQKQAAPDSLLVSQTTMDALPTGLPATPVGELTGEGGPLYRIDRPLRRSDVEP